MKKGILKKLGLIHYAEAMDLQREVFESRRNGRTEDTLLILQHFPVVTIGSSGSEGHILVDRQFLKEKGIEIYVTDRGGDVTFHGPEQMVAYPILNLKELGIGVMEYVRRMEEVVIRTLNEFSIPGIRQKGFPGVWVGQEKICSVGFKVSKWITKHGLALNVNTDLKAFSLIVPCGIEGVTVTSMEKILRRRMAIEEVEARIISHFSAIFHIALRESVVMAVACVGDVSRVRERGVS